MCGYVRGLLGVDGAIFNLVPIAQVLKMPEDEMDQVIKSWEDDDQQLQVILDYCRRDKDALESLAALRKAMESLKQGKLPEFSFH